MDYTSYDRARYMPDPAAATAAGLRTLRAIAPYLGKPQPDQSVLEIGCGPGSLLYALYSLGIASIRGIDTDQTLVDHAKNILQLDVNVADWHGYLSATSMSYDTIIALDVLEHIHPVEVEKVLAVSFKRLKPNGKLILRMPNADCPLVNSTFFGDVTHRFLATPTLLRHLLRTSGFSCDIQFGETYPDHALKRLLYSFTHNCLVKPMYSLIHFHFYGERPKIITRNMYCCARRGP